MRYALIIILTGILLHLPPHLSAQTTEVGLNVTNVISNFFSLSDTGINTDPHTIMFRRKSAWDEEGKGSSMRFKLGLGFLSTRESDFGFNSRVLDDSNIEFRVGFEKQRQLKKKFEVYYGMEFGARYERSRSVVNSGIEEILNLNEFYGIGLGPYMGFQYYITERLSVYTESSLYAQYIRRNSEFTGFGNSEPFTEDIFRLNHILPNSLYFSLSF